MKNIENIDKNKFLLNEVWLLTFGGVFLKEYLKLQRKMINIQGDY